MSQRNVILKNFEFLCDYLSNLTSIACEKSVHLRSSHRSDINLDCQVSLVIYGDLRDLDGAHQSTDSVE